MYCGGRIMTSVADSGPGAASCAHQINAGVRTSALASMTTHALPRISERASGSLIRSRITMSERQGSVHRDSKRETQNAVRHEPSRIEDDRADTWLRTCSNPFRIERGSSPGARQRSRRIPPPLPSARRCEELRLPLPRITR